MKHIDFKNFELEGDKTGGFDIIGSVINKRGKKVPTADNKKPKQPKNTKPPAWFQTWSDMVFVPFVKKTDARFEKLEANDKMIFEKLEEHSKILKEHSRILEEHSKILDQHSRILKEHSLKFECIIELNHLKT